MPKTIEVTVKFIVQIPDDAGAAALDPEGVYVELGHIAFLDGAGDSRSLVADESDVVEYRTVGIAEVEDPLDTSRQLRKCYWVH